MKYKKHQLTVIRKKKHAKEVEIQLKTLKISKVKKAEVSSNYYKEVKKLNQNKKSNVQQNSKYFKGFQGCCRQLYYFSIRKKISEKAKKSLAEIAEISKSQPNILIITIVEMAQKLHNDIHVQRMYGRINNKYKFTRIFLQIYKLYFMQHIEHT